MKLNYEAYQDYYLLNFVPEWLAFLLHIEEVPKFKFQSRDQLL